MMRAVVQSVFSNSYLQKETIGTCFPIYCDPRAEIEVHYIHIPEFINHLEV